MFKFFDLGKKEALTRDIDQVIGRLKSIFPDVNVYQIEVQNPLDDDGIWYFWLGENTDDEIQVDSSNGNCPFDASTFRVNGAVRVQTIDETVKLICEHLRTSKYNK